MTKNDPPLVSWLDNDIYYNTDKVVLNYRRKRSNKHKDRINPMESKNGTPTQSLRTSDRLRKRPKYFNKGFLYYQSSLRKKPKSKKRTAASHIAKKILTPRKPSGRTVPSDVSIVNFPFSSSK